MSISQVWPLVLLGTPCWCHLVTWCLSMGERSLRPGREREWFLWLLIVSGALNQSSLLVMLGSHDVVRGTSLLSGRGLNFPRLPSVARLGSGSARSGSPCSHGLGDKWWLCCCVFPLILWSLTSSPSYHFSNSPLFVSCVISRVYSCTFGEYLNQKTL